MVLNPFLYPVQYHYKPQDYTHQETVCRTLSLVLSELSQLITGFTYCYENEMHHWCNKNPPALTELGPTFKRVHRLLQQLVEVSVYILTQRYRKILDPFLNELLHEKIHLYKMSSQSRHLQSDQIHHSPPEASMDPRLSSLEIRASVIQNRPTG